MAPVGHGGSAGQGGGDGSSPEWCDTGERGGGGSSFDGGGRWRQVTPVTSNGGSDVLQMRGRWGR
jgi:hypothetical protein